jgi:YgiT-type zinc finger domain-containing protein
MNCPLCRGEMTPGTTHVLIERSENSIIVINKVPALICEQCGDDFIDIKITRKIEILLDKLEAEGVKMGFVDYNIAA